VKETKVKKVKDKGDPAKRAAAAAARKGASVNEDGSLKGEKEEVEKAVLDKGETTGEILEKLKVSD
jgi:tyrosyl-tRNA synthetase